MVCFARGDSKPKCQEMDTFRHAVQGLVDAGVGIIRAQSGPAWLTMTTLGP